MNKTFLVLVSFLLMVLVGCGISAKEIAERSVSEREDVFHEIDDNETPRENSIDLIIDAQFKTHLEGLYLLESKNSLHGKAECPFLFNIDGQSVTWQVKGQKENDKEYKGCMKNHDCGEGMRYILKKRIRLKPGVRNIFFGLPGENFRTEFEVILNPNQHYYLELKPVYVRQSYLKGIVRLDAFLNNAQLIQKGGGRRPFLDW